MLRAVLKIIRRVLAKSRLILDEIFRLYRKFGSYLRPISHKMRLIFPRIIGLLSSSKFYCKFMQICSALNLSASLPGNMPIVLSRTLLCVRKSYWNIRNQYNNYVQLFVVLIAYRRAHFFVVRCLRRCQVHVQAVAL